MVIYALLWAGFWLLTSSLNKTILQILYDLIIDIQKFHFPNININYVESKNCVIKSNVFL